MYQFLISWLVSIAIFATGTLAKNETSIDEEILGGVIIKVGSKMLDSSLSTELKQLESISKKAMASC